MSIGDWLESQKVYCPKCKKRVYKKESGYKKFVCTECNEVLKEKENV